MKARMRVYHMSYTLEPGAPLTPDYKRMLEHTTPYIQALERSEDCFYGMVLQGKFMYSVFRRSHICMEWIDFAKWATEAAFEWVRRSEFPGAVSRLQCNYFYDNLEDVRALFAYEWAGDPEETEKCRIYELELADDTPQYYDMRIYDMAYEAMEKAQDLKAVFRCARRYFAGERTDQPVLELMSAKPVKVVRELLEVRQSLTEAMRQGVELDQPEGPA